MMATLAFNELIRIDKSDRKRNIRFILMILIVSSFTTNSERFSEFDGQNMILFQIKIFGRNIEEIKLARY